MKVKPHNDINVQILDNPYRGHEEGMKVKPYDDINVQILDDPYRGHFLLVPNSLRRDVVFEFKGLAPRQQKPFESPKCDGLLEASR